MGYEFILTWNYILQKQPPEVFTGKHVCQSVFFNNCNFIKKETPAQLFSCKFGESSKNNLFTEHLCTTATDFICGVFFIFYIIKNFRLEKSRFVRKKSTSGKPA